MYGIKLAVVDADTRCMANLQWGKDLTTTEGGQKVTVGAADDHTVALWLNDGDVQVYLTLAETAQMIGLLAHALAWPDEPEDVTAQQWYRSERLKQ